MARPKKIVTRDEVMAALTTAQTELGRVPNQREFLSWVAKSKVITTTSVAEHFKTYNALRAACGFATPKVGRPRKSCAVPADTTLAGRVATVLSRDIPLTAAEIAAELGNVTAKSVTDAIGKHVKAQGLASPFRRTASGGVYLAA